MYTNSFYLVKISVYVMDFPLETYLGLAHWSCNDPNCLFLKEAETNHNYLIHLKKSFLVLASWSLKLISWLVNFNDSSELGCSSNALRTHFIVGIGWLEIKEGILREQSSASSEAHTLLQKLVVMTPSTSLSAMPGKLLEGY